MKKDYLAIDLGTDNTIIYSSQTDSVVYSEPTCIAFDSLSHAVKDIGFLASKIKGKTPYSFEVVNPVVNGLINDDEACYQFLATIFSQLKFDKRNRITSLLFTTPSFSGKVNRKVIVELGKKLFAKEIYIEPEAKIAALGTGDNVYAPTSTLVLDIGAGVSDVALLSMGEVVSSDSTMIAGHTFDEAIRRYMIQKQHLNIGIKTAENIKMRIANLSPVSENRLVEVKGRDTMTSLPSSVVVSSGELKSVLVPLANYIALKVTDVISTVPPELAADLTKNGLILTGGGSLLSGMKDFLQETLSIPVRLVSNPMEAVVEGFKVYIQHSNKE